jgi:hypothetical protein
MFVSAQRHFKPSAILLVNALSAFAHGSRRLPACKFAIFFVICMPGFMTTTCLYEEQKALCAYFTLPWEYHHVGK